MLTAFKKLLRLMGVPGLYALGIALIIASVVRDARWGLYLLVALIPQPNLWYKFHQFPGAE